MHFLHFCTRYKLKVFLKVTEAVRITLWADIVAIEIFIVTGVVGSAVLGMRVHISAVLLSSTVPPLSTWIGHIQWTVKKMAELKTHTA